MVYTPCIILNQVIEAGDGVFLKTEDSNKMIHQGQLLGFIPGMIFSSLESANYQQIKLNRSFITSYDGTTIDYSSKIPYPFKLGYSKSNITLLLIFNKGSEEYQDMNDTCNKVIGSLITV